MIGHAARSANPRVEAASGARNGVSPLVIAVLRGSMLALRGLWSATTGRRLYGFADSSAKQGRVQRLAELLEQPLPFDGDKSPAKSADKSAHSKAVAHPPGRVLGGLCAVAGDSGRIGFGRRGWLHLFSPPICSGHADQAREAACGP